MRFVDIDREVEVRVTFEAENNLDFRLGTGPLRHSKLVESGDISPPFLEWGIFNMNYGCIVGIARTTMRFCPMRKTLSVVKIKDMATFQMRSFKELLAVV